MLIIDVSDDVNDDVDDDIDDFDALGLEPLSQQFPVY